MAPVAVEPQQSHSERPQKFVNPVNPFYSPSTGDDADDDTYEFAKYKVPIPSFIAARYTFWE